MSETNAVAVSADTLREYEFFEGLDAEALGTLAGLARVVKFAKGETIFATGDSANSLYILKTGTVNMCVETGAMGSIAVSTIRPGQAFGWSGVVPPYYFSATAQATEASSALAFAAPLMREAMKGDAAIAIAMLTRAAQMITGRLRDTRLQLIGMLRP